MASREEIARALNAAPFAWVEISDLKNKEPGGEWDLGRRLWSPAHAVGGADRYKTMREPRPGDLVLHFIDMGPKRGGRVLLGVSTVVAKAREVDEIPPRAGQWADRGPFLIIDLDDFRRLDQPLSLLEFVTAFRDEITAARTDAAYPFAFKAFGIEPQLQYLTRAPERLVKALASALRSKAPMIGERVVSGIWLDRTSRGGLAAILRRKLVGTPQSIAYLAELRAWADHYHAATGGFETIILLLTNKGYTARIGSVKQNHERVIWLVRGDQSSASVDPRKVIVKAMADRPDLKSVLFFRPDPDAVGGFSLVDCGFRELDPLVDALAADGLRLPSIQPFTPEDAGPRLAARLTPPSRPVAAAKAPVSAAREPAARSKLDDFDWSSVPLAKVMKTARIEGAEEPVLRALAALASGMNVIFVGPPGTGKTSLAAAIFEAANLGHDMRCASDHWTTYDTIGGYFPEPAADGGGQKLVFRRGAILESIAMGRCLIVDEINRADIDKAFGELFTIFGGAHAVELSLPLKVEGEGGALEQLVIAKASPRAGGSSTTKPSRIEIPSGWRMIGSMNDADRASLKRFSLAFARRFAMIPVRSPAPADYADLVDRRLRVEATRLGVDGASVAFGRVLALVVALFAEPTGLAALGAPLGPGFALTVGEQAIAELARDSARSGERAFLSALELYVAPQFQGAGSKHGDLVELVRTLVQAEEGVVTQFDEALAAWTGGTVAY